MAYTQVRVLSTHDPKSIGTQGKVTIMARNMLALYGLRAFLKENPEQHDQGTWGRCLTNNDITPTEAYEEDYTRILNQVNRNVFSCGTSACAAGWAALLNGATITPSGMYRDGTVYTGDNKVSYRWVFYRVTDANGMDWAVEDYAREVLGLDAAVAGALFNAGLTHKEVLKALKMLIKGVSDEKVIKYLEDCLP